MSLSVEASDGQWRLEYGRFRTLAPLTPPVDV